MKINNAAKEILHTSLSILIVLILSYLIVHFVGQRTVVSGSSMVDTLSDGDNVIVDKISYRFDEPQRFDVIVFPFQHKSNTFYIKRIIALPGETIKIDYDGNIYINGNILKESYGTEVIQDPGIAVQEITLSDDEYFVMGDNRNNSSDSRDPSVGPLKRSIIIGKAWVRIFPFNKMGKVANIK